MKKIYSFFCATLFCLVTNAQPTFQWAKSIGSATFDAGIAVVFDASGNVYTTGIFSSIADFDPGPGTYTLSSAGSLDFFVSKLDASGNFLWAKSVGGIGSDEGESITVDALGNVYISGSFSGTNDFDPGPGVFNLTSGGWGDAFILKLDASGNFVWAKAWGSTQTDTGYSVKVDAAGNIYIAGPFTGTVDVDPGPGVFNLISAGSEDVLVNKLDASGNFIWARKLSGTLTDRAWTMALDAAGDVYTCGFFQGTTDFDPGVGVFNLTSAGINDVFISKIDASGNFVFAKQIGGTGIDYGMGISVDPAGNIYYTGFFNSVVDFDPGVGTFTMTSAGADDIFISKLDASGNFVWAKRIGAASGDDAWELVTDATGNVYTTGSFIGTVDFDPGAGTFNLSSAGTDDVFISKLDAAGNFVWAVKMGAAGSDFGRGIALSNSGYLCTVGAFNNTVDFDPGPGSSTKTSVGTYDIFIQKLATCTGAPTTPTSISGANNLCVGAGAQTYSIAAVIGATSYTWTLPGGWTGSSSTNTISATPGSSGVFSVTASNACGTSSAQTLSVTINPLPVITASTSTMQLCIGDNATLTAGGGNTYTWNPGGLGTSIVISPTVNTTYTLSGTNANGCSNSTVITQAVINCPTSVLELKTGKSELEIYPNPFSNKLTIITNGTKQDVQIFNTLGSLIYKTKIENEKTEIDLTQQSSGIYFIKIGFVTNKIIKQ